MIARARATLGSRFLAYAAIFAVAAALLGGGYWLYQQSVADAVGGTTSSFMAQVAEHDAQGIRNQMNGKWDYLEALSERIRLNREENISDISYMLGIERRASAFEQLYLITEGGTVYADSYLKADLGSMPWGGLYETQDDRFAQRYDLEEPEIWGEYLLYGVKLDAPIACAGELVEGVVGLVPLSNIESSMQFESFDGEGVAMVIQSSGDVVTAGRYSNSIHGNNYFKSIEGATFLSGSYADCVQAVEQRENAFVEYRGADGRFYAALAPIEGSDWYLVVKVSSAVTTKQVGELMARSLLFFALAGIVLAAVLVVVYRSVQNARIARESEKAKSAFLANMSHEIRTPLNGLVGLQYLMRQNLGDKAKVAEYLDQADVSAEYLKSVITDVLDMSKIESGQMELYPQPFDLGSMLRDIDVLIGSQAKARNLSFAIDAGGVQAPRVVGDEMRIKQSIVNLLGNSLKFTPEGGAITLCALQTPATEGFITTFTVSDTGCGMSPEFLERIWEPFEQERRTASRNGTGLGTALTKVLVEKMGGTISVKSQLGQGSTFTIDVPLPLAEEQDDTAARSHEGRDEVTLEGMRVLVAEDNDVNRMIIEDILADEGCDVTAVCDGRQAVDAFVDSDLDAFGVVLLDLQMPVMTGYEAAEAIRALDRPDGARVPILALTANAFHEDVEHAKRCGIDEVVTKPLDVGLLLDKLKVVDDAAKRADGGRAGQADASPAAPVDKEEPR
ncbi:hybrid sensor histidine kinase/response regulator [Arabiibacter massiliensis]|uniref:hybrid sensor histidine kinase/response regulator n=1 Tax=Arabiibacter massiliensis TaxID=1870985 RepID=UPI0009BB3532|nr:hybrid sensor histidine kinase/response regulator [Arabiibacter massiliensis]